MESAEDVQTARDQALDPFRRYRALRDVTPVHYSRQHNTWSVFRYDDVRQVLSDHQTFSVEFGGTTLISLDPPRHTRLRALVAQAFSQHAVKQLSSRIAAIVDGLLDNVVPTGAMDVIDDLAYPLPAIVIAELLGIPSEDRDQFRRWSNAAISDFRTSTAAGIDVQQEMGAYFQRVIAQRRHHPKPDLISALLAAQVDDGRLSEQEMLGLCILLLVAGNETTTNLIGNAVRCFCDHQTQMEYVRAHPDALPAAIEEVLRYYSPIQRVLRIVTTDVVIGGHKITRGQTIVAWIGAANRDPARFSDPDRFDIHRAPNPHIAFGHGVHFCLGAALARLEARIALSLMLRRLNRMQHINNAPVEPIDSFQVYGIKHFPVMFVPS